VSESVRFPVVVETPVAWGEMDAFGHVNNAVFLRYFESARIAYFDRLAPLRELAAHEVRPILARATIDYRRPLQYPDHVKILAGISKLGNTSFVMNYRLESEKEKGIAAEGDSVIVMLNYKDGTKVTLSPELRAAIESVQTGA
jgi:acyl-CoA thioester hydrolase